MKEHVYDLQNNLYVFFCISIANILNETMNIYLSKSFV